jgi:hypothetical protein
MRPRKVVTLPQLLHNIDDHARTLLQLLDEPSTPEDLVTRLKHHILMEEEETAAALTDMGGDNPSILIRKAIDHSFFLRRMIEEDAAMSQALIRELLDHFIEEHEIWATELSSEKTGRQWTVGPLWPKGGQRVAIVSEGS